MHYPYATFYLEAQRAKRDLLHVFKAEPDVPAADPVLPAAKCAPAQTVKKKADSKLNLSEKLRYSRELFRDATRNLVTQKRPGWAEGDMSASSVIFTIVLLGTILAGHTEHPVFWLSVGPAPLGIGFTAIMVVRRGLGQDHSLPTSPERNSHGTPSQSSVPSPTSTIALRLTDCSPSYFSQASLRQSRQDIVKTKTMKPERKNSSPKEGTGA